MSATSSSAIRSVRGNADRVGIAYDHFRGGRRWSDTDLESAIADAESWADAADRLELRGGSSIATIKRHAARLGLYVTHLDSRKAGDMPGDLRPVMTNLRRAGPQLAAAWFTLCGRDVSWPLEPCRYDLMVSGDGSVRRVQVKTTITRSGGAWQVFLSTGRRERKIYTPDEIDDFFIIDGGLNYYLVPIEAVRGLHAIHLRAYGEYRVSRDAIA